MNAKEKIEAVLRLAPDTTSYGYGTGKLEVLALLQDCLVIPKAELPEGLGNSLRCAEHDYRVGNTVNPNDFDDLAQAAQTILKHSEGK